MEQVEHQSALITGASAGIGAEFARQLARLGYNLVLVARRREKLELIAGEIRTQSGVEVEVLPADLSSDAGIVAIEERIKNIPDLEMLVNNAGFGIPGGFIATEVNVSMTMLWVHVIAPLRFSRAALPTMIANGRGFIINVSSTSAFSAATGSSIYSATKGFLNNFSEGLSVECFRTGVKVQALCPGFTITEFHDTPDYKPYRIKERMPRLFWMKSENVVRGSLRALSIGRVIYVPGFGNKLIALAGKLGLVSVIMRLYMSITGKRPVDVD
jgi:short-subunit dehydrogenase